MANENVGTVADYMSSISLYHVSGEQRTHRRMPNQCHLMQFDIPIDIEDVNDLNLLLVAGDVSDFLHRGNSRKIISSAI